MSDCIGYVEFNHYLKISGYLETNHQNFVYNSCHHNMEFKGFLEYQLFYCILNVIGTCYKALYKLWASQCIKLRPDSKLCWVNIGQSLLLPMLRSLAHCWPNEECYLGCVSFISSHNLPFHMYTPSWHLWGYFYIFPGKIEIFINKVMTWGEMTNLKLNTF